MIEFPYSVFTQSEDFPIHLQYGFHDADLYLHGHLDYSELVIVLGGKALHLIGAKQYPIHKGSVFVVGERTEHGFAHPKHLSICNIMFKSEALSHILDMNQLSGFQAMFVLEPHYAQNDQFLARLHLLEEELSEVQCRIDLLMQEYKQKRTGWRDMVLSGFHSLCVMISRCYRTDEEDSFLKLAAAIAYMEQHFTEHITTTELAARSGYSERQFLRLFHELHSTSPIQYLTRLRIERARYLLRVTALPIGEIAWCCGFEDQNYFTRAFRNHAGMTPSAFRKMYR